MSFDGLRLAGARLILPQPAAAAWNMSLDQAILQQTSAESEAGNPTFATIRFYTWDSPTLSLGYFQTSDSAHSWIGNNEDLHRVRRSTGGGAILHDRELTYSVTVPTPRGDSGARTELYRAVHQIIANTLRDRSITARPYREDTRFPGQGNAFLCFARRTDEDLILSGYKVLGSAQRRARQAVLQHGSLLLRSSVHAPQLPGIYDLTSKQLEENDLAHQIADGLAQRMGVQLLDQPISEAEINVANTIQNDRFRNPDWWLRR